MTPPNGVLSAETTQAARGGSSSGRPKGVPHCQFRSARHSMVTRTRGGRTLMTVPANGPLAGVRVLDLAGEAGVFVGRALAELGADVIRAESGADRVPRRQPFLDGIA